MAKLPKQTHVLGNQTYNVSECKECKKIHVQKVQYYYGNKIREELKMIFPILPNYPAEDLCDCHDDEDDGDED